MRDEIKKDGLDEQVEALEELTKGGLHYKVWIKAD